MSELISTQLRTAALEEDPDRSLLMTAADVIDELFHERNQALSLVSSLEAENQYLKAATRS